ncbi:MAG: DDE transposase family protein [Chloroflexi bacterium]|nr:DDE transposase family protein [Chloroflexota bacterium]
MTSYKKLVKSDTKFLSMTGFTDEEFQALLPLFANRFNAYVEAYTLEGKKRAKRKYAPYKNSPLPTIEDKLLFILIYLKTNNLQNVQAELFGMHQPEANLWIHVLEPLLNQALGDSGHLPARSMEELEIEEDCNLFFHDGTERPIQRPVNNDGQKEFYSGKKNSIRSRTTYSVT